MGMLVAVKDGYLLDCDVIVIVDIFIVPLGVAEILYDVFVVSLFEMWVFVELVFEHAVRIRNTLHVELACV